MFFIIILMFFFQLIKNKKGKSVNPVVKYIKYM